MKFRLLYSLILLFTFTACTPDVISSTGSVSTASVSTTPITTASQSTESPSVMLTNTPISRTPIPGIPTATPISAKDFIEPDSHTWVEMMPAVREYFYFRRKAITSNDIEVLWDQYPELKNEKDCSQGINCEELLISIYQDLKPIDGNFFPEKYERIKINIVNDKAEVFVHGLELFLWIDEDGNFQDTGGEINIILFMQQINNRWVVYKTDWIQMNEINPFSP